MTNMLRSTREERARWREMCEAHERMKASYHAAYREWAHDQTPQRKRVLNKASNAYDLSAHRFAGEVPALLAHLDAAEGENERLRGMVREMSGSHIRVLQFLHHIQQEQMKEGDMGHALSINRLRNELELQLLRPDIAAVLAEGGEG